MLKTSAEWLAGLRLDSLIDLFEEQEIDLEAAVELTEADLKELGLPMGPRKKLLRAIAELREKDRSESQSTSTEKADKTVVSGQNRQVTILFSDIVGFTRLSSRLDAEQVHSLLQAYFGAADEIIRKHGGVIDKHIGDSVMAVFGVPVALGNEAERALDAALAIQAAMEGVSATAGENVQAHIGLASGRVVANTVGSLEEFTVIGESVNLAARLTDKAGAGEIVLSEAIRSAMPLRLEFGQRQTWHLKGFDQPVAGFLVNVGFEKNAGSEARSPIIGRTRELGQFNLALSDCLSAGRGQFIYLRGEAGIGKTRLAQAFSERAQQHGFDVHRVLVLDFGAAHGQDAVRSLLRSLIGLAADASELDCQRAVEEALISGQVLEEDLPHLHNILGLPQQGSNRALYDAMDTERRKAGHRDVVRHCLIAQSKHAPIFVIVEDVHWAQASALETLADLIRSVENTQVILVATTRIESDPFSKLNKVGLGATELTTLDLKSLRPEEALQLSAGFNDPSKDLVRLCIERAKGNPLFLEQLLRNATASGFNAVPDTVQSLVQASLDKLSEHDRNALEAAAVMGQQFQIEHVRRLVSDPHFDPSGLISNRHIQADGGNFLFAHALVRDGVYSSILGSRRRKLHARMAELLGSSDLPLRARHLEKAEDEGAPLAYLEAARHAAAAQDEDSVVGLSDAGLTLHPKPEHRAELLRLKGDALRTLGQTQASIEMFQQAVAEAKSKQDMCLANIGAAEGMRVASDYAKALDALQQADQGAEELPRSVQARIQQLRGSLNFPLGNIEECVKAHEAALTQAQMAGDPSSEAASLSGLGDAFYLQGLMKDAQAHFAHCVEVSRKHDLGRTEVANLHMVGWSRMHMLELREALQDGFDAARMAERVGQLRAAVIAHQLIARISNMQGNSERAAEHAQKCITIAQEIGAAVFVVSGSTHLAHILAENGKPDEARSLIQEILPQARSVGKSFCGPYTLAVAAKLSTEADAARAFLAEAEAILDDGCVSHNYMWFAEVALPEELRRGNLEAAERHIRRLNKYTLRQPLAWSQFIIDKGRVLLKLRLDPSDVSLVPCLEGLIDQAAAVGMDSERVQLSEALKEINLK